MGGRLFFFKPDCFSRTAKTSPLLSSACNHLLAAMWYYCLSFLVFTYLQSVLFYMSSWLSTYLFVSSLLWLLLLTTSCAPKQSVTFKGKFLPCIVFIPVCTILYHVSFVSRMSSGVPWVESRPINTCLQRRSTCEVYTESLKSRWQERLGSKPSQVASKY